MQFGDANSIRHNVLHLLQSLVVITVSILCDAIFSGEVAGEIYRN